MSALNGIELAVHPDTNDRSVVIMTCPELTGQVLLKPLGDGDTSLMEYTPIAGETFPRYVDGWSLIDPQFWNDEFGGLCSYVELVEAVQTTIKEGR